MAATDFCLRPTHSYTCELISIGLTNTMYTSVTQLVHFTQNGMSLGSSVIVHHGWICLDVN